MICLVVLMVALGLAAPALAATAPLTGTYIEPTVLADADHAAFPAALAAVMEGYRGFSEPVPPYPFAVVLQLAMLVALSLAIARALPRNRRKASRRDQVARAAAEMSRMR